MERPSPLLTLPHLLESKVHQASDGGEAHHNASDGTDIGAAFGLRSVVPSAQESETASNGSFVELAHARRSARSGSHPPSP